MRFTAALFLLVSGVSLGSAQLRPTAEQAIERVTGQGMKEWVLTRFRTYLSPNAGCSEGETWAFHESGTLEIRKCVQGKIVRKISKWRVQEKGPLDLAMTVGDLEYSLILLEPNEKSNAEEMRLRIIPRVKTDQTVEMRFTYERD